MSRHVTIFVLFVALMQAACTAQDSTVSQTVSDFRSREGKIESSTQEDYHNVRELLANEALSVASREIASKEAEELLHWIVKGGGDAKTAHAATELLIAHHASSPASIRELLSYAINPTGCTPELFAGFKSASPAEEQRWIVLASSAIHQKSLLLIADELAANENAALQYRVSLGSKLANRLAAEDRRALEDKVIADFRELSKQHGEKSIGGMTINELVDGSIFAVQHLRLGKVAKGLSGNNLDGKVVTIEDFRGRALLINFWATWCAPCATAVPDLAELSRERPSSKFAILGISVDQDHEVLKDFIEKHTVPWNNIADIDGILRKRWQILSLPSYYVLDEKGVIRFIGTDHFGAMNAVTSIIGSSPAGTASMPHAVEIAKSIFADYDKNKDGRLEKIELPEGAQAIFEMADTNKDGALSLDEVIAFEANPPTEKGDRTKR